MFRLPYPPLVLIVGLLAAPLHAETVTVFAAASLAETLDEAAAGFEAATGHDVVISYAGSGALAQQIIDGAPAQLFLSASVEWADAVTSSPGVAALGRVDLLANSLVLIGPAGTSEAATVDAALAGLDGKLAMGLVDAVPAGQYGKAALTTLGLWDGVAAEVVQAENVRLVLALVARGEAAQGIVYATDSLADPSVSVLARFPEDSHPPIVYPLVLLNDAAAAKAFFDYLQGDAAGSVFRAHGFQTAEGQE